MRRFIGAFDLAQGGGTRIAAIPIPRSFAADRDAIAALVQQILDLKRNDPAADVTALEAEIDAIVDRLYFGAGSMTPKGRVG